MIKLTIADARISESPCQYKPGTNVVTRVYHTVVSHGINLAYCDTREEAEAVVRVLQNFPGVTQSGEAV